MKSFLFGLCTISPRATASVGHAGKVVSMKEWNSLSQSGWPRPLSCKMPHRTVWGIGFLQYELYRSVALDLDLFDGFPALVGVFDSSIPLVFAAFGFPFWLSVQSTNLTTEGSIPRLTDLFSGCQVQSATLSMPRLSMDTSCIPIQEVYYLSLSALHDAHTVLAGHQYFSVYPYRKYTVHRYTCAWHYKSVIFFPLFIKMDD